MQARTAHPYYNYARLLSHNGTYNFLVGGRGLGKTFGAKEKAIKDFIRTGTEQFIYLRRFRTELAAAKHTFFDDVAFKFPRYDFRVHGVFAQMASIDDRESGKRNWVTIGYFVALSVSQSQKSVAFPNVTKIIFDEFISESSYQKYLPDECTVFNNFYSTVDRYQDKTKVFFLANAVSIMNPYFIEYNIEPSGSDEIIVKNDGFIVVHIADSDKFTTSVYQTKFGRFIKNTDYATFAVGNSFDDNSDDLIALKHSQANYLFTLEVKNGIFSVWNSIGSNEYYVQVKRPKQETVFTTVIEHVSRTKLLILKNDAPLGYLRTAFRQGRVSFDTPNTRNAFLEIFK